MHEKKEDQNKQSYESPVGYVTQQNCLLFEKKTQVFYLQVNYFILFVCSQTCNILVYGINNFKPAVRYNLQAQALISF